MDFEYNQQDNEYHFCSFNILQIIICVLCVNVKDH
jgi:hypothetical protein